MGPDGLVGAGGAWDEFGPLDQAIRELEGPVRLGAVGLAIGSALGAWVELTLLSALVRRHVPSLPDPRHTLLRPGVAAAVSFALTAAIKLGVDGLPLLLEAVIVVAAGVAVYAVVGHRLGVRDSQLLLGPVRRLIWR